MPTTDPQALALLRRHVVATHPDSLILDGEIASRAGAITARFEFHLVSRLEIGAGGADPVTAETMVRLRSGGVSDHRFLLRQQLDAAGEPWHEIQDKPVHSRRFPFEPWQAFPGTCMRWVDWMVPHPGLVDVYFAPEGTAPAVATGPAGWVAPAGCRVVELACGAPFWHPEQDAIVRVWIDPDDGRDLRVEHHLDADSVRVVIPDRWEAVGGGLVATRREFHDPLPFPWNPYSSTTLEISRCKIAASPLSSGIFTGNYMVTSNTW